MFTVPPTQSTNTKDYLTDLDGWNVTNWIVVTERRYAKHRFGGFSAPKVTPGYLGPREADQLTEDTQVRSMAYMLSV